MEPASILRNPSIKLNDDQKLILDSIGFTFQMIKTNFDHLNRSLLKISLSDNTPVPEIFSYCWSFIDNFKRFFSLYEEYFSTLVDLEIKNKADIKEIRNTIQHLDERISELLLKKKIPFYGMIQWIFKNEQTKKGEVGLIISGLTFNKIENAFKMPNYDDLTEQISNIRLTSVNRKKEVLINISEAFAEVVDFTKQVDEELLRFYRNNGIEPNNWAKRRDVITRNRFE